MDARKRTIVKKWSRGLALVTCLVGGLAASDGVAQGATLFVDAAVGDDAFDGLGWATPLASLSEAIVRANAFGDVPNIFVATGVYRGDVVMPPGTSLIGGFASGGTPLDPGLFPTVLEGDGDGSVVTSLRGRSVAAA